MVKRGESGLCLVVGVDKPTGMTSHDVVSRCHRIFGEKRVGHTGTLDPLASGVLPICIGPATRLDAFMTGHDKRYLVRVVFGEGTDTDDCMGDVTKTGEVPEQVYDFAYASCFVSTLVGKSKQIPPIYSAIKVNGRKACDEARKGHVIELEPRDIEVYEAKLVAVNGIDGTEPASWDIAFSVSKGTYIRALARDIGTSLGVPAHVGSLRRLQAGAVTLADCVSLDTLEEITTKAALDPVRLLGMRFAFLDEATKRFVMNGNSLREDQLVLCERLAGDTAHELCACTSGVSESCTPPFDHELVLAIADNRIVAIYEYSQAQARYKTRCMFPTGVYRGSDI